MKLYLPLIAITAWIVFKVGEILYNAFFHPLSCFPGPAMARISRWWLYKQEMTGEPHLVIQELHNKYGKAVRISPNELSINDAKSNATIYGQGSKFTKARFFYRAFENHAGNLFTICDREAHLQDKRLMANSFSRANIIRHEAAITRKVDELMGSLEEYTQAGKAIPLVAAFRCLTIDTITEFCYGKPLGAMKDKTFFHRQFEAFDIATMGTPFFQHFPFLRQCLRWVSDYELPFVPGGIREMEKGAKAGLKIARSQPQKQDKGVTLFQDILTSMTEKGIHLDDKSLVAEGIVMNFAGTDTTAATLATGIYHLCRRPELYLRVQTLLREKTKEHGGRLGFLKLQSEQLLDACLKESLRLACPVGGRLPREVPRGGWEFDGHHIPAGFIVGSSPFYECYNEAVFPNAYDFRPERWLTGDITEMLNYFHPFSRGTRQCIGQNLALLEQRIAFAAFVMKFTPVEIVDKNPCQKQFFSIVFESDMAVKIKLAEE